MTLVRIEPGPVWRITLARPQVRNAVSPAMLEELSGALGDAAADPEARVVLLTGEGPDFCAGADLAELSAVAEGSGGLDYGRALEEVIDGIAEHPVPVIASIQGAALGAGCQIAVACDLAVAATDAHIGIPSSRLGVVIEFENIQRLVLSVGSKRAAEILHTGRELSGEEAADWGLVNEAVPPSRLRDRAEELAERIAAGAPLSIRASKRGIQAVLSKLSVDRRTEGGRLADFDMMAAQAFSSEDLKEGIRAFRERRRPDFHGK
jgi:enoyl-CoA hydratase/carnithine racemase